MQNILISLDITENGQLDQIIKKWHVGKPICSPLIKKGKILSIEKLSSLFIIVSSGIILSLIIMFIENVLAKFRKDVDETEILEMMHEDTKIKLVIEVTLREFQNNAFTNQTLKAAVRKYIHQQIKHEKPLD